MNKDLEISLINLIRHEIGEYNMVITPTTEIENGLGVTGDDAWELIHKISKEYQIDISEFDFSKYFHAEPSIFTRYKEVHPLTIEDIIFAIKKGKLI